MPIPLLLGWGIAAGAAAIGGAIGYSSRNSEIDRLKSVIRTLQAENRRLHAIIAEQQEQINTLKEKYKAVHKLNFLTKHKYAQMMHEALTESYMRKEQLEIIYKKAVGSLTSAEERFYNLIMTDSRSEEENLEILNYVNEKYSREIEERIYPEKSLNAATNNIKSLPTE